MAYTPIGRESGSYYQDPNYPTISNLVRPNDSKRPSDTRYPPNSNRPSTTIYDPVAPPQDRRPTDNRYPSDGYRPPATTYEPNRYGVDNFVVPHREPDIYRPGNNYDYNRPSTGISSNADRYPRPQYGNGPSRNMEVDIEVSVAPGGRSSHKISYCNSCNPSAPQSRSTIFIDNAYNVDFTLRSNDNKPQISTDGTVRQQPALQQSGYYPQQILY